MYLEPRDLNQKERYTIYNSLRNNMRLIRLQNYSDIDSYIIQNPVTGAAGAGAKGDENDEMDESFTISNDKISQLLGGREPDLPEQNMINKINNNIASIQSIKYIFKQISDTLDDGIQNIQTIQGTDRQKTGRIKSNFNNTSYKYWCV